MKINISELGKLTIGIDEAGRGPTLGPLVMAGCLTTPEIDVELKAAGVKDSKMILPAKREKLLSFVKEKVLAYSIIVISPDEIDSRDKNGLNLNQLEAVHSIQIVSDIIKQLEKSQLKGREKTDLILDSPSNNPPAYKVYVESIMSKEALELINVRPEIKADVNHVSVSAASILAKVTRDALIEDMEKMAKMRYGVQTIGSGYPSDPYTVEFMSKYWDKFDDVKGGFFRKTWASWKNVAAKKGQKKLF